MKILRSIIFFLCFSLMLQTAFGSAVVATVNDQAITTIELKKRVEAMIILNNMAMSEATIQALTQQTLYALIDEKLLVQLAKQNHFAITAAMLKDAVTNFATAHQMTDGQLTQYLKEKGIAKSEIEQILTAQLIWNHILKEDILKGIQVSENEINEHITLMRTNQSKMKDIKLKLAEIVIVRNNHMNIKENSESVLAALKQGMEFENIVQEFSVGASREDKGMIGWAQLSQLAPEVVTAVKNLKIGQVSSPIEQNDTILILKVLDKQDVAAQKLGAAPTREEMEGIIGYLRLKKANAEIKSYLSNLRSSSSVFIVEGKYS